MPAHQQGRARRGQDAAEQRVPAAGCHPGSQRRLEHLARLAGVAHDEHLRGVRRGDGRRGTAQRQRQLGREELAGHAAHPVGAEQRPYLGAPLSAGPAGDRAEGAAIYRLEN